MNKDTQSSTKPNSSINDRSAIQPAAKKTPAQNSAVQAAPESAAAKAAANQAISQTQSESAQANSTAKSDLATKSNPAAKSDSAAKLDPATKFFLKSHQLPPNFKVKKIEFRLDLGKFLQKGLVYLIIGLLFLPFLASLFGGGFAKITLSQLVKDIKSQQVTKLEVAGDELRAKYQDGSYKVTLKEPGQEALTVLSSAGLDLTAVDLQVEDISFGQMVWELVINFLPIAVMVVVFAFIFRQARGAQDGLLGFGQSKAKLFVKGKQNTKFADVGGMEEAKKELEEIVDFLRHPKKYTKVGARTPKGVLLVGPSGTGKTLLARAVAGEAGVQFLSIAGSEFMEMLVGVGASRVRDLFATAKKLAPSIIFIDEIDAIGQARGRGDMGGHNEREQTLNQILVEMDGFEPNDNVMVMAATNRGDMLDPALVRPGRFDRRVQVSLPDLAEREQIIKIHAQGKPLAPEVKVEKIAKSTVGFSGADLENMMNEAAIRVARDDRQQIVMEDIDEASLKVKLGPSKKRLQDKKEKEMTAYHEAGHAVIAHVLPNLDPVHRISIISRGRALGFTFTPPERDKLQTTKSELLEEMVELLAGRAAEQLKFGEQTAGASNDIEKATAIARSMVVDYGMSDLGPMNFGPHYDYEDYARNWAEPVKISDHLQQQVDQQVKQLIDQAEAESTRLLKKYDQELDGVSAKLLEVETLDGEQFAKIMGFVKVKNS